MSLRAYSEINLHITWHVKDFGTAHLPWVLAYVRNQRKRHAEGKTVERLERTEPLEEDVEDEEETGQGPTDG